MAHIQLTSRLDSDSTWLHRWIYYLSAGFMFAAVVLRAFLVYRDHLLFSQVLSMLVAWLFLFACSILLVRRSSWFLAVLLGVEIAVITRLLLITHSDFFAFLFAIANMQAMQKYSPRVVGVLIGFSTGLTFVSLFKTLGVLQAVALALVFAALSAFLSAYIWSSRQAVVIRKQQQALVSELQEANLQLEFQTRQQEQLAAGRERLRLARDLHDSITQTIFSMVLTTQSALILLESDRQQIIGQLDRLDQMVKSALSEMQVLISRLTPETLSGGFVSALKRHLEERRRVETLVVVLEVEGNQPLSPEEETGLFRIVQEALNNITKHAGVSQAVLRLHLCEPFWMEIEDHGTGFDPLHASGGGRMGLAGMGERAAEIGWGLLVESTPGKGTRIRIEKNAQGVQNT